MRLTFLVCAPLILAACATAPGAGSPRSGTVTTTTRTTSEDAGAPLALLATPALASEDAPQGPPQPAPQGQPARSGWRPGEAALQGYLGASWLELDTKGNSISSIQDDDISFPTIGGGGQWKLAGEQVDFGLEALFSFSWRGNVAAVAVGGGGAAIAVDVDLLMWDVYGGPFLSVNLGGRTRLYGGAGPLLRWTIYDQDGPTALSSGDGDGFGVGYYARTGIEFAVARNMMIGVGVRWTDVEVDLDGRLGDLEANGVEALFTVTQGF